jgi:hypothetical protein
MSLTRFLQDGLNREYEAEEKDPEKAAAVHELASCL